MEQEEECKIENCSSAIAVEQMCSLSERRIIHTQTVICGSQVFQKVYPHSGFPVPSTYLLSVWMMNQQVVKPMGVNEKIEEKL